jgi:hypothetical protein
MTTTITGTTRTGSTGTGSTRTGSTGSTGSDGTGSRTSSGWSTSRGTRAVHTAAGVPARLAGSNHPSVRGRLLRAQQEAASGEGALSVLRLVDGREPLAAPVPADLPCDGSTPSDASLTDAAADAPVGHGFAAGRRRTSEHSEQRGRRPVRGSGPGWRLTRRGRLVAVLVVAVVALAVFGLGRFAGTAQASDAASAQTTHTVVVKPGETLWQVAKAARPSADPRDTIAVIRDLNSLHGSVIQAGQSLVVPQ